MYKKYTHHRTRSASVRDREKSCGSGFADWRVRSPHIFAVYYISRSANVDHMYVKKIFDCDEEMADSEKCESQSQST